jgi:hypothetical protein
VIVACKSDHDVSVAVPAAVAPEDAATIRLTVSISSRTSFSIFDTDAFCHQGLYCLLPDPLRYQMRRAMDALIAHSRLDKEDCFSFSTGNY